MTTKSWIRLAVIVFVLAALTIVFAPESPPR
jgi:hypothetical protein